MRVGSFVLAAQFPGQGQGEALHRAVRTAEVSEESGLDSVWLAEHHFVPYGVCPSSVTFAALLLGRTRRIRVGTAVSVLPTQHPVALGEQAALLHLTAGGRFTLGVGRGGPWVDLEVFGQGVEAYERHYPESLDLLLRWLREPRVAAAGERFSFREVAVVPRPDEALIDGPSIDAAPPHGPLSNLANGPLTNGPLANSPLTNGLLTHDPLTHDPLTRGPLSQAPLTHDTLLNNAPSGGAAGPEVVLACTSPASVRLAAERGLPMLLGMHIGDEEKAEMVALWRSRALAAGRSPEEVRAAAHVSAGVVQIEDRSAQAAERLLKAMPGWLKQGLDAHVTVDGRERSMRDPLAYTELLCGIHPVGTPKLCADRLAATSERTGITRFALLVEGSGDLAATEENVRRLGAEVLPRLQ
ncbi:LLM class flavin-dependent oxidoreductase [Streptomyces sp. NPDC002851]